MSTDSIYQVVRRHISEGLDPEQAADAALTGMTKAQLVEFVRPEVERLARSMARERVRRVERRSLRPNTPTRPDAIAELVAESFPHPDGYLVRWGAATVEQHLARAEWQRSFAGRVVADAERHEFAAKLIRDRGVSCLDEIADWSDLIELAVAA